MNRTEFEQRKFEVRAWRAQELFDLKHWDSHGNYKGSVADENRDHPDFRANDEGWDR